MREIKIYVGPGLDAEGIKNALNRREQDSDASSLLFDVAHALLNDHSDDRAEIHEVTIDEVTVDPVHRHQVYIDFTTSWSMYFGCRDMNTADDENESEVATYTSDGYLIFIVPTPRRPANYC